MQIIQRKSLQIVILLAIMIFIAVMGYLFLTARREINQLASQNDNLGRLVGEKKVEIASLKDENLRLKPGLLETCDEESCLIEQYDQLVGLTSITGYYTKLKTKDVDRSRVGKYGLEYVEIICDAFVVTKGHPKFIERLKENLSGTDYFTNRGFPVIPLNLREVGQVDLSNIFSSNIDNQIEVKLLLTYTPDMGLSACFSDDYILKVSLP